MAKIILPPYFEDVVNDGERRLLNFLEVKLPDDYYLIPCMEIGATNPRNNQTQFWEYDVLVIAPHGIYNIENKDWKGRIEGNDNYWYVNDRERKNPLKTCTLKGKILASKLKEFNFKFGKAFVQSLITLSYNNLTPPAISGDSGKLTFTLDSKLIDFIQDPHRIGQAKESIKDIQTDISKYISGESSKRAPKEKKEILGYEILEILEAEPNFIEYLVKPKGVTSSVRKKIKEYILKVKGLGPLELIKQEEIIKNQYNALIKLKANPYILNVEFVPDEDNHLFYEISDFLDEYSLRSAEKHKTFHFHEKIGIIKNIIAALKIAHGANIFHRDINPDNIYMSESFACLGNFGKSYFTDHNDEGYTVMATITEMNATPYHPLELTCGEATISSDIYSLGILIYWLFTGSEPVKNPFELDRLGGKLPDDKLPSSLNASLPKWIDEVCNKTILTDPSKRFANILELEKFINESLEEKESKTKEEPKKEEQSSSTNFDALKEGDKIGDYIIYKTLGQGGYSKVFKVKHSIMGTEYALKLYNGSVNRNSVLDEYNSLKNLNHPNIVKFAWNGALPETGQFFTLTEYIEGDNLSDYIKTDARLPINRIFQLGKDILGALVMLQSQTKPIFHRDIKPQNIIYDPNKGFILIDFNIASANEDNKDYVCTPTYLAPDLVTSESKINWNKSADPFALGVTMYELICKQHPWSPLKIPSVSKEPNNPQKYNANLSDKFTNFLLKAISTDSKIRYTDAAEMLKALLEIGEENLLEQKPEGKKSENESIPEGENIVKYINSLFSQAKKGNTGTRASFDTRYFDQVTYTPTKLDKHLIPAVLDDQFKLLIITGNAGDGKTAFIRKIEEDKSISELTRHQHKNGARFKIKGTVYESNYDGSQDEDQKANNNVLEEFFKGFENISNYNEATEGRIIAINEGRLVEFLKTTSKHEKLHDTIEDYFYNEGHKDLPEGLMIINLNLRSIVASETNTSSLFRQQIQALTQKKLWTKCEGCELASACFIKYNVDSFNDSSAGEEVITRMEWLLKTVSLKRELHITMRDLRSMIAYILTRDYECEEVHELYKQNELTIEKYWENYYFNITNSKAIDHGNQDRLIKLLRETDIGEVAIPNLDRDLYFGFHTQKNFLEFSDRGFSLHEQFNRNKISVPAHEQKPDLLVKIKHIQKIFVRHQYYEGKVDLMSVANPNQVLGKSSSNIEIPTYLLRLPYNSIFDFYEVMKQGTISDITKQSISRAISLNEGCDNKGLDQKYLVLASTEIKDPPNKSFRLFNLNDFEIFVNKTDHLVKYLEYQADSLIFRHKNEKNIRLLITLDLFEMLYFIQQGFSPSLNDLRGKFIELIVFKNLIENLSYSEVILTNNNINFYKISKEASNNLLVESITL
jgi:serine/threonine protein kinase